MKWMRIQTANKQEVYSINLEAVIKIHETTDTVKIYYGKDNLMTFTTNKDTTAIEISEDQFKAIKYIIPTLSSPD